MRTQHNKLGGSCCGGEDVHYLDPADWGIADGAYWVRIAGERHRIDPDRVIIPADGPNRSGRAVLWYDFINGGLVIRCFSPGSET